MENWLEELKSGDKVIVQEGNRLSTIRVVEKVTPTQIKVRMGGTFVLPFKKTTGEVCGKFDRWAYRKRLLQASPESIKTIEEANILRALQAEVSELDLFQLTKSQLEQIIGIVKKELSYGA